MKLLGQNLAHQVAGANDLGVAHGVEDVRALAAMDYHTPRTENRKMLGKIGLGNVQRSEQFRDASFSRAKGVKNLETLRMGEGLADLRMQGENIWLHGVAHIRNTYTGAGRGCQEAPGWHDRTATA